MIHEDRCQTNRPLGRCPQVVRQRVRVPRPATSAAHHGNDVCDGVAEHDELEPICGVNPTQDQTNCTVGENDEDDEAPRLLEPAPREMEHDQERRGDHNARRSASTCEPDDGTHGAEVQHDLQRAGSENCGQGTRRDGAGKLRCLDETQEEQADQAEPDAARESDADRAKRNCGGARAIETPKQRHRKPRRIRTT